MYPGRALVYVSGAVGFVFPRHDDGCDGDDDGDDGDGEANVDIHRSAACLDEVG